MKSLAVSNSFVKVEELPSKQLQHNLVFSYSLVTQTIQLFKSINMYFAQSSFIPIPVAMAALKSGSKMLDYWREYFRSSNGDIFETIEKAIMCIGCNKVELGVIGNDDQHEQHGDVEVYNGDGVGDLGLFHCDGSHVKHNKATGDNVGPLLLKRQ
ncbi:hypothetical protein Tco_0824317 [Tanacetum coccineum]|uniref:Uncharacterized protein n=1 Tax=Tanacetum coccineum TaxID=301880 RepID=A0ABQ5APG0_9ASTR